jgi:hypothetical protein
MLGASLLLLASLLYLAPLQLLASLWLTVVPGDVGIPAFADTKSFKGTTA